MGAAGRAAAHNGRMDIDEALDRVEGHPARTRKERRGGDAGVVPARRAAG